MEGPLEDLLEAHLDVVFIGFNPGLRSGETGHHYAGRGNRFWDLLYESGLTPVRLTPEQDRELLHFGLGSTNLVARATAGSGDLGQREMHQGAAAVLDRLAELQPRFACYLGKGVYRAALAARALRGRGAWGQAASGKGGPAPDYGPQSPGLIPGVADFLAPNPSGRSAMAWPEKLGWFVELARLVGEKA